MDDELSISLTIAGIKLSFPIQPEKEEVYRDAAKLINSLIMKYKGRYSQVDPITFLVTVAMENTVKLLELEKQNDVGPVLEEIEKLSRQIELVTKE